MELQLVQNWEAFRPYFAKAVDFIKIGGGSHLLQEIDKTPDHWTNVRNRVIRNFDLYGRDVWVVGSPASKIISILLDQSVLEVGPYDPTDTFFEAMCSCYPSLLVLFGINWKEIKEADGIYHEEFNTISLDRFELLLKWPILDRYLHGVFIRMYEVGGRNDLFSAPISILSLLGEHEYALRPEPSSAKIAKPYLWFIRSLTDHNDSFYAIYDRQPTKLDFPELVSFCDFVAGSLARFYMNQFSFSLKKALYEDELTFRQKISIIGSNLDLDHPIALTGYFIKNRVVSETVLLNTDMRSVEEIAEAGAKIEIELHFALASETGHDAVHFPCGTSRLRVPERIRAGFVYQGG